jgi:hypothetical protein
MLQPKGKWLLDVVPESFPQEREQLVPSICIGVAGEAELLRSGAFRAALHDEFADEAAVRVELVQTSVKRIQQIPVLQNRLDGRLSSSRSSSQLFSLPSSSDDGVVKGQLIAAFVEAAAAAVHIAEVALACRADAAAVFLLAAAVGVDVAVVIVKVGLADRHPLVQVLEVDYALL